MKKYYVAIITTAMLIGCGGGNSSPKVTTNDNFYFKTSFSPYEINTSIIFQKTHPFSNIDENISITDVGADLCEFKPLLEAIGYSADGKVIPKTGYSFRVWSWVYPKEFTLTKLTPLQEVNLTLNTKYYCYSDNFTIYYTQKIGTAVENRKVIIKNDQYNQQNVTKITGDDPLYKYQWHLKNTGQDFGVIRAVPGEDINVEDVWKEGITGKNVTIGVIDTGVDLFHPDLKDNIDIKHSYNYITATSNTTPFGGNPYGENDSYAFAHATAVAGIIAAKGWNGIGTRGVAPNAKIASLNSLALLIGQKSEDGYEGTILQTVRMLDALVRNLNYIDIYNNSWSGNVTSLIDDINFDFDTQVKYGVKFGRKGLGAIYVKSAGNGGEGSNANFEQLQTNGYFLCIGAVGADGKAPSYSTPGSAILISAPGGGVNPDYTKQENLEIVTTDLPGNKRGFDRVDIYATSMPHFNVPGNENYDYTYFMNGTSAAAPVVSGVIALMLEANPNLSYRDVKIILARTARVNDVTDFWQTNAAGHKFNYKYGFGVVDAKKAVEMAKTFTSVGTFNNLKISSDLNDSINQTGNYIKYVFNINNNIRIEDVLLTLTIHSTDAKNLEITLTSPSYTKSLLVKAPNDLDLNSSYTNTRLLSTNFLDEISQGKWVLEIKNKVGNNFTLKKAKLIITGH